MLLDTTKKLDKSDNYDIITLCQTKEKYVRKDR